MLQSSFSPQAILSVLKSKQKRSFEQLLEGGLQANLILDPALFHKPRAVPLIFISEYLGFEDATLLLLKRQSFVGFEFQGQSLLEEMVETEHLKAFQVLLEQGTHPRQHLELSFWQAIRLHFNAPNKAKPFLRALFKAGLSVEMIQETMQERNLDSLLPLLYSYRDEEVLQTLPAGKEETSHKRL